MRYFVTLLLLLCGVVSSTAVAGSEKITSRDFAYGYMLKTPGQGPLYSLPLPNEVYRQVRRADLGDIQVFNGAGEAVPYALRTLKDEKSRTTASVPFFPLYENESGQDDISLSIRRDADGTILDFDSSRVSESNESEMTGYLLDLGKLSENTGSLELHWMTNGRQGSATVSLQQSADLQHWYSLVRKVTLVDIEYAGNRVVQRKIHFRGRVERYLKMTWQNDSPAIELESVTAVSRPIVSRQNLQWVALYNGIKSTVNGFTAIDYTSNYRLPVRNVRLRFTEPNAIIHASIQSRAAENQEWREQCRGVFYSVQVDGQTVQSEPCSFRGTTSREWRLVVLDDGAGLSGNSKSVMIDLGWKSDELIFMARGTPPFLLAYGSGKIESAQSASRTDMVLAAVKQQGAGVVFNAGLGKKIELGGDAVLEPPTPPKPWKTWLLWGVLIVGVLLMAMMAITLIKDMKKAAGETNNE